MEIKGSEMKMDRYYVDERVGCVAVRDRKKDDDSPGLHSDTSGVVKYWSGKWAPDKPCEKCGKSSGSRWELPMEIKEAAYALCEELNNG